LGQGKGEGREGGLRIGEVCWKKTPFVLDRVSEGGRGNFLQWHIRVYQEEGKSRRTDIWRAMLVRLGASFESTLTVLRLFDVAALSVGREGKEQRRGGLARRLRDPYANRRLVLGDEGAGLVCTWGRRRRRP
jgi:hypothetical protein